MKLYEVVNLFGDETGKLVYPDTSLLSLAAQLMEYNPLLKYNAVNTKGYEAFYKVEPDLHYEIQPEWLESIYLLIKYEKYYDEIPIVCSSLIDFSLATYSTVNELGNLIDAKQLTRILKDITLLDFCSMVKMISGNDFNFVTEYQYKTRNTTDTSLFDVYIPSTNRIAIIKSDLAKLLVHDDIDNIKVINNELCISSKPIACLLGGVGATSGTYDLSRF